MLNIETLKAGRIYSFRHESPIETVAFRKGDNGRVYAPEWLKIASITRKASFKGNLAGPETYTRAMQKENPDYVPTGETWFEWTSQPGIVAHKKTLKPYLALLNPETIKAVYFVNGIEASPEELEAIKAFKKGNREHSNFALFDLTDKVEYAGELPE